LRIAVTGTRGKSSVTRLLASVLREHGHRVLAKTTGSQALVLLPDGGQVELDRSVTPSILEQKQWIRKAARLKADCLVAEVMSLRAENHYVESHHSLRPNVVAITNVRRDHTEIMGETEDEIASVLCLDICEQSTVFVPEHGNRTAFRAEAARRGARLLAVPAGSSTSLLAEAPDLGRLEFAENLELVEAVATHLGVRRDQIIAGIRNARHDVGRLKIWRYHPGHDSRTCYLVNAFAANDPESTLQVLNKVAETIPSAAGNIVGILNLRSDRLPRTLQWISALRDGALNLFQRLFVTGDCSAYVRRRLPGAQALKAGSPLEMTRVVCAQARGDALIFGFGNVKGAGRLLAEHWHRIGEPYGI
jgi:poly-gamma-glutamate synthase PgsB/CapB